MQKGTYLHGLTILAFNNGKEIFLCCDCFKETIGHYGSWDESESNGKIPYKKEGKLQFCSLCRKRIIVNRRRSATRRVTNYSFHLPERRKRTQRKTDIIAWQKLKITQRT